MRIAILGSGLIGGKLGTLFARAGHQVTFSYARSMDKLERLAAEAGNGARVGSPAQAAMGADVVLLAVHWSRIDDVLALAGDLPGKTVISCSLPMTNDDTALAVGHTSSGAEKLAARIPEAHVVSAFSTTPSEVLFGVFEAKGSKPAPTLVHCGDDQKAKEMAAELIADLGFNPLDAGALWLARYVEPFSLLVASIAYDGGGGAEVSYRIERQ
jgi:8-hydroxy-5-deazaflavin:NADPH oxidoreductase